jgi:thiol-disulfide isomerase/thioredoxin
MEGLCPARRRRLAALLTVGIFACAAGAAPAPSSPAGARAGAAAAAPSAKPASPGANGAADKPAAASTPAAAPAGEVKMSVMASGASQKIGGYNPQQAKLAKNKPAGLKKAPEMKAPLYGQIPFGGRQYVVALDEPEGEDARLYVDANGNGDLTDDAPPAWEKKTGQGANGAQLTQYSGTFQLPLPAPKAAGVADDSAGQGELVTLSAYRFDKNDPQRQQLKSTLMYYSDYAYEGEITLGGKSYKAMLTDMGATGQFSSRGSGTKGSGNLLFLDINGDGAYTPHGEVFEPAKPFNVKGTTYAMAFPGDAGAPVKIAVSNAKVAEIPLPPNHSVGAKITPFKARRMDGKAVNFPADYKGKVVMLDFWATWCGPCMGEVPNLVSAYNQYHPQGVEILGISLDQPNAVPQIKKVTTDNGMTWPQVYDGKFWKAEVAQAYGINSIPAAFLVDGDTGEILAAGGALRGGNLQQTFEAALAKKKAAREGVAKSDAKPGEKTESAAEPAAAGQPAPAAKPAEPKPAEGEKPKDPLPF